MADTKNKVQDQPPYFFMKFPEQQWGFISSNQPWPGHSIPLEKWKIIYKTITMECIMCRVAYTKDEAKALMESTKMMEGPEIYRVIDNTGKPFISVWKTKNEDLEIAFVDKAVLTRNATYGELVTKIQEWIKQSITGWHASFSEGKVPKGPTVTVSSAVSSTPPVTAAPPATTPVIEFIMEKIVTDDYSCSYILAAEN